MKLFPKRESGPHDRRLSTQEEREEWSRQQENEYRDREVERRLHHLEAEFRTFSGRNTC